MKKTITLLLLFMCACNLIAQTNVSKAAKQDKEMTTTAPAPVKYDYETVPGDPLGVKIYTLRNGLKMYMSVNKTEPRVQTNIAVRAGSKHDPAETTGLAHYLEHMLFKGTRNIGALNWDEEEKMLQQISDLYEQHRNETDAEKRKEIYAEIDRVSNEAAKLVAANEYDKMVSSLGAKGTNAYTWVEQTVYVNDIPSNELERWMKLESERFKEVVLRLFHTELEAVYEEFNIGQDRDFRKTSKAVNETLFPTHPYGTQTTIGTGEHLKNPSHVKIQEYFKANYKPNNMAIILAGDFNPDEAVATAEKYFGTYEPGRITPFKYEKQAPLTEVVKKEVFGQEAEWVELAWRFEGASSADVAKISMLRGMLYNRQAGLMDLNLLQAQKVLEARASTTVMEDYSVFKMNGKPREGQTLEDVEALLLAELDKIRKGDFPDWLMSAVIKDMKLSEIRNNEFNGARAYFMTNAFVTGVSWENYVKRFEKMEALTKNDIVNFANAQFKDNYVVIYKRSGDDPNVVKVDKPAITPVDLNRENTSAFTEKFMAEEAPRLKPEFVDYDRAISTMMLKSGIEFDYIKNENNPTFSLDYIVEMGKNADPLLPLAVQYLPYLGTDKYTSEQLQEEFFKLGLSFDVYAGNKRVYVSLSGLDESLEEGVALFEHILANVKADPEAWENVVNDIQAKRANTMKDKRTILRTAMTNYAKYGEDNPYTNILNEAELRQIAPETLATMLRDLTTYEHNIFYYGSQGQNEVAKVLNEQHTVSKKLNPVKEAKEFKELDQKEPVVYFVDFPMVQAEFMMISKGTPKFNKDEYVMSEWYNNYFGFGLSSIVFQEIRESQALAYSAYAFNASPREEDLAHYFQAYVGTQVDKLPTAIPAMQKIVEEMPVSEQQIEQSRQSIMKKIETDRITGSSIYWSSRTAAERGFDYDLRKDTYARMQTATPAELIKFQKEKIKGREYSYLVLGSKESVDMEYLKSLGKVVELTLEDVFGYEVKP